MNLLFAVDIPGEPFFRGPFSDERFSVDLFTVGLLTQVLSAYLPRYSFHLFTTFIYFRLVCYLLDMVCIIRCRIRITSIDL